MNGERWKFDKHIPIAVILVLFFQTVGIVWWAAQLSTRVDALESWVSDNRAIEARLSRIETQLTGIIARMDRQERNQ